MFKTKKIVLYIISAAIVIFVVPIGLNYLLPLKNSLFNINGNEEKWFSFWSSYSGAVISGLITLIVLYSTLKHRITSYNVCYTKLLRPVDFLQQNKQSCNP